MSPRARYAATAAFLAASVVGPNAFLPFTSDGSADVRGRVVLSFRDDRIDESSGLVVRDGRLFTVNDSGDGPYLYEVDLRTGRTSGVTTFAAEDPTDDEALAPGRGGVVWVGDIGDNRRSRGSVRVYRMVPPRAGGSVEAAWSDLVYPDGPHDAETLLVRPQTGRLFVVTKSFTGAVVYQAPMHLQPGQTYQLERVGSVPGLLTDGTFLPDGRHVLVRGYGGAAVYTFPGFEHVADVALPRQEQGEGIAVDGHTIYLSSEGVHSQVLAIDLPRLPPPGQPAPSRAAPPRQDAPTRVEEHPVRDPQPWMGVGPVRLLGTLLGAGVLAVLVRAVLRRSRRRP